MTRRRRINHRRRSRGMMRVKIMMTGCGLGKTDREREQKRGAREKMMEM